MVRSQSLVGTVGHAFALRSFNFLTIMLLLLWALSPLGGQSALRLVHETNSTLLSNRNVFYADLDAPSQFPETQYWNEDAFNGANAVLTTSLMTADNFENSAVDTWNHPKIPRLEALEQAEEQMGTTRDWYAVVPATNYTYASLTGINIIHLAERGTTNFTVPYEYMYFGCDFSTHSNITRENNSFTGYSERFAPDERALVTYLNGLNDADILESGGLWKQNATSLDPSGDPFRQTPSGRSLFFLYENGQYNRDRIDAPSTHIWQQVVALCRVLALRVLHEECCSRSQYHL